MTKVPRREGFTARTKARKRAADILFEAQTRGMTRSPRALIDLLDQRRLVSAAQTPLPSYAAQIVEGVASQLGKIDSLIDARQRHGGLDRLPGVDLAIMRVAVWEMLANPDVDPVIAIDEAVAIAKAISTAQSPATVNAILDGIRHDIADGSIVDDINSSMASSTEQIDVDQEELDLLLDEY